jgi:hypothetical protein
MQRKVLAGGVLGLLLLCTSVARADERSVQEISVQGTGLFTNNAAGRTSAGDRITQHATDTGGLLLTYRTPFRSCFTRVASKCLAVRPQLRSVA